MEVVLPLSLEPLLPSFLSSSRRLQVPPPTHLRCSAILVKVVPETSTETSWWRGVPTPPLGGGGRGAEGGPPRFCGMLCCMLQQVMAHGAEIKEHLFSAFRCRVEMKPYMSP